MGYKVKREQKSKWEHNIRNCAKQSRLNAFLESSKTTPSNVMVEIVKNLTKSVDESLKFIECQINL